MIDGMKLLGGLLEGSLDSTLGRGSRRLPGKAAVGMGILGVAMAAFEHFSGRDRQYPSPLSGGGGYPTPPPPPPPGPAQASPPPFGGSTSPPPPPPGNAPSAPAGTDPLLLLRAMVGAAHADGTLDDEERRRITTRLERAGLTEEERLFLAGELESPRSLAEIVAAVSGPEDAEQVFAASLLAVRVDTQEERIYLEKLRQALGIDPMRAVEIARDVGR